MNNSGIDKTPKRVTRPYGVTPTPARPLFIAEVNMMALMNRVCARGVRGINNQKSFLEAIGANPTILRQIRHGKSQFTARQYLAAAQKFGVTMDWIFGLDARPVEDVVR